jgi:hypothetical protein
MKNKLSYILLFLLFIGWGFYWAPLGSLWDFQVYSRAVNELSLHANPYQTGDAAHQFPFVYHPAILWLFSLINNFISLNVFFIGTYVAITTYFLVQFNKVMGTLSYIHSYTHTGLIFITALVFGGAGIAAIMSGNLSTYMHLGLLATFMMVIRSKSGPLKHIPTYAIFFLALIKPYFLAYLAVPLCTSRSPKKSLIQCALLVASFTIGWVLLSRLFTPEYEYFLTALSSLVVNGDIGYSLFGLLKNRFNIHSTVLALSIHAVFAIVVIVIAGWFVAILRKSRYVVSQYQIVFLTYFICTIINPRMKEYDFFAAALCLITFICISYPSPSKIILPGLLISQIPLICFNVDYWFGTAIKGDFTNPISWQVYGVTLIGLLLLGQSLKRRLSPQPKTL